METEKLNLVVLLDMQYYMINYRDEIISGFNSFMTGIRKNCPELNISVFLISDKVEEFSLSSPVSEVNVMTEKDYFPTGVSDYYFRFKDIADKLASLLSGKTLLIEILKDIRYRNRDDISPNCQNVIFASGYNSELLKTPVNVDSKMSGFREKYKDHIIKYISDTNGFETMFKSAGDIAETFYRGNELTNAVKQAKTDCNENGRARERYVKDDYIDYDEIIYNTALENEKCALEIMEKIKEDHNYEWGTRVLLLDAVRELDFNFVPIPVIILNTEVKRCGPFSSKIGGTPYIPGNFNIKSSGLYTTDNKSLFFIAQINLSEMPYIDKLPTKGILQFYCYDDSIENIQAFLDYSKINNRQPITSMSICRVIYHDNITDDISKLKTEDELKDFIPDTSLIIQQKINPVKSTVIPIGMRSNFDSHITADWIMKGNRYDDEVSDSDKLLKKAGCRTFPECFMGYNYFMEKYMMFRLPLNDNNYIMEFVIKKDELEKLDFSNVQATLFCEPPYRR